MPWDEEPSLTLKILQYVGAPLCAIDAWPSSSILVNSPTAHILRAQVLHSHTRETGRIDLFQSSKVCKSFHAAVRRDAAVDNQKRRLELQVRRLQIGGYLNPNQAIGWSKGTSSHTRGEGRASAAASFVSDTASSSWLLGSEPPFEGQLGIPHWAGYVFPGDLLEETTSRGVSEPGDLPGF